MLNRNRLVAKADIAKLDLSHRARIEAEITDARAAKLDLERYRDISLERFVSKLAWRRHLFGYLGDVRGKRVLDICCGYSMTPVLFAMAGAEVVANDVAPLTLEQVRRVAEMHGVADRIEFYCGPAEKMPFPDHAFDLIYGGAALHHLQLEPAGRELARLLRPGGRGGFQDPLAHNRILEFARDNLQYRHKHPEKGTDHPLKVDNLATFGRHFASWRWQGFDMLAMAPRAFPELRRFQRTLERVDTAMFGALPFAQRYARFAVTLVSN